MIASLGIGARGLDTPAERDFLRDVMTGRVALEKDTIRRLTLLRAKMMKDAIKAYNSNLDEGMYKTFEQNSGRPLRKIEIPEIPDFNAVKKKSEEASKEIDLGGGFMLIN